MKKLMMIPCVAIALLAGIGATHAQSIGIGKDGSLKIDSGDGNTLDLEATGGLNAKANDGNAYAAPTKRANPSIKSKPHRKNAAIRSVDNVQRTVITGNRVNVARGRGAVSVQNISGREDSQTGP